DNHIGDWGTQFGMIIYGYKHFVDEDAITSEPVAELSRLYRLVNTLIEYHNLRKFISTTSIEYLAKLRDDVEALKSVEPSGDKKTDKAASKQLRGAEDALAKFEKEVNASKTKLANLDQDELLAQQAADHPHIAYDVLNETAQLHAGDATNKALWEKFLPACLAEIQKTYDRLNVSFDHALGESFYHDRLAAVGAIALRGRGNADHGRSDQVFAAEPRRYPAGDAVGDPAGDVDILRNEVVALRLLAIGGLVYVHGVAPACEVRVVGERISGADTSSLDRR
ncbi:MAG: arginine--tRNA ligase, partial [Myxococcota bacterium]